MFFKKIKEKKEAQEKNQAIGFGILAGIAQALYCSLIILFFNFAEEFFPPLKNQKYGAPIFMLILLVFSAGISGLIVFGYPAYLALRKDFKLAIIAAVTALLTIIIIGILILAITLLE